MNRLALALLCSTSVAAHAQLQQRVLVVAYQSLGVEPAVMERVEGALRAEATAASWASVDPAEAQRALRAATMCGEDRECLATLGQRGNAHWVLAWGFGKVGSAYLFTSMVVETPSAAQLSTFSERLSDLPSDPSGLATRAIATLFRDVKRPVSLPPPSTPQRTLVAPTIAAFSLGGAATVSTVIFGVLAATHYPTLASAQVLDRPALDRQQRTYNLGGDVSLGVAVVSAATALVLFILGAPAEAPKAVTP